jgi:hypothetical protein
LLVASQGGMSKSPFWYYNIVAHPCRPSRYPDHGRRTGEDLSRAACQR